MKDMVFSIRCGVCASDSLISNDRDIKDMLNAPDETEIKCLDCNRIINKKQLINENKHIIDANKKEFVTQVLKDIKKRFS